MTDVPTGALLVAAPQLVDPNFFRAVILVCSHDDNGSLGVILNRPTDAPVAEFLPAWVVHLAPPDVVFVGGPVQPEVAVALARRPPGVAPAEGWTPVAGGVGLLDLSVEDAAPDLVELRVFSGYAGWSAGQLEAEISAGDWFVVAGEPADSFTDDPEHLWREVLRRQPTTLARFAHFPPDPSLN